MTEEQQSDFNAQIEQMMANAAAAMSISMGTRLGLFSGLAELATDSGSAVTSEQLADKMNFKERYVREWLGCMACARIVDHKESDGTDVYWLEPHRHLALLGNKMAHMAHTCEMIVAGAETQKLVEKCFPLDGPSGTSVDDHPSLHTYLERGRVFYKNHENIRLLFADCPELAAKLEAGISVLELGCGAAHFLKALASLYPKSQFTASDLSNDVLDRARKNCEGLNNVNYIIADACHLSDELTEKFDLTMCLDVLHDVPYPAKLLQGAYKSLKTGGVFLLNEIDLHSTLSENKSIVSSPIYYAISLHYCVPTCLNCPDGAALGACAGKSTFEKLLNGAGFQSIQQIAEPYGLYYLCCKQ